LVLRRTDGPYGSPVYSSGRGEVKYTFSGKEQDGSDLFYFWARYYDPEIGRFISVDPIHAGGNWYAYCYDNPVRYVDPLVKKPIK
jgi:RHS repeat-associated protein